MCAYHVQKNDLRCFGRPCSGSGTKIHAHVNQNDLLNRLELTPGQAHDVPSCKRLLAVLQSDQFRPTDKAYDVDRPHGMSRGQGYRRDPIQSKPNIAKDFDAWIYKKHNKIMQFSGNLKKLLQHIATRCKKTSRNSLVMIKLVLVRLWDEFHESAN